MLRWKIHVGKFSYIFISLSLHFINRISWNRLGKHRKEPLLEYLEKRGITLDDLIETVLELHVPHPGVETKEEAVKILKEEFRDALSDVNVSCLIVACLRLEEECELGKVPGLSRERFRKRPMLVADELLGMTIACYIAGARGLFEFIRFDKVKPGILKKLGPISNDAIGGLVAGVSANMYTRSLREVEH
jgi:alpha-ribazole phosphatase CobZ